MGLHLSKEVILAKRERLTGVDTKQILLNTFKISQDIYRLF